MGDHGFQLLGSNRQITKRSFRHPSRHGFSSFVGNSVRPSPSRNVPWTTTLKRWLLKASYVIAFIFLSFCISMKVEQTAITLSRLRYTPWPRAIQRMVNLFGTGIMDPVQPLVLETEVKSHVKPPQINWRDIPIQEETPVVFMASHVPKIPNHPAIQALKQARKNNDLVYLLGPKRFPHLRALNIIIEPIDDYMDTIYWVMANIGNVKIDGFGWWMLKAFMEKHKYQRILYLSLDVMLYANATEILSWLLPQTKLALPMRWPTLRPPPVPSQYASTSVSAHVGVWSLEALSDFLEFWRVAVEVALFGGGEKGSLEIAKQKEYSAEHLLGWYSYSDCWQNDTAGPPCMAEPKVGITSKLAAKIRKQFIPKFTVESLCKPRWCQNSTWSDYGLCVFDNNFSVALPARFFRFGTGDKCPTSKLYEFYDAWMGGAHKSKVQFLAVHFQGSRRNYLKVDDKDPTKYWGSSPF